MDFSKVHLDFSKTRLRGLPKQSAEPRVLPEEVRADESNATLDVDIPGEIIAHAPQYTAVLTPLTRDAERSQGLLWLEHDVASDYMLAVTHEGVLVWKRGNDSTLLFPLPSHHNVRALFVPPAIGEPPSQPGLVTVDRDSGSITYWESVSRAVVSGAVAHADAKVALDRKSDTPERIQFIELLAPIGLAIGTSEGKFYLVYLRDSLGRRAVRVTPLHPGGGILARIRSIGAYARDTRCMRAGRTLANGDRELYILNMYGDLALWRVGVSGTAVLLQEAQVGAMLHMHMNILYPNSGLSLIVHDVAVEDSFTHVLATFAPRHDSHVLYFVVASLSPDLDVVSVQRLQAYESPHGVLSDRIALRVVDGILCAVLDTVIAFLDTPSRASAGQRRWEESVALKQDLRIISSTTSASALTVSTSVGFVSFHFKAERGTESTTKARLEQSVFDGSAENPLDLTRWPAWEYNPDPVAPKELAVQIAVAETPFLPAQLPSLLAHLELRAHSLIKLHEQCATHDVREIAQAVVAAATLFQQYNTGVGHNVVDEFAAKHNTKLNDLFIGHVLKIPELIDLIATKTSNDSSLARALVLVLQGCDGNSLGMPQWARTTSIRTAIETLAAEAVDTPDADLLGQTATLLCGISSVEQLDAEPSRFLQALALLGRTDEAIEAARRFKVFSAIAAIEVGIWLDSTGDERKYALATVRSLIAEFGKPLATAIYDVCISRGQVAVLVQELAPTDVELAEHIELYLESRKLYSIAWTLEPATHHSTELLGKALECSSSVDARRLFASLYKLSALSIGADEMALQAANRELGLVAAQESLATQYFGVSTLQSAIARHAFAPMSMSKPLSRNDAVDLLALAPPKAPAEANDNFIRAFELVDAKDTVRQRLLVQQLICNSNWEPVDSARDEQRRTAALRQTLFVHTLTHIAPAYAALLSSARPEWFMPPTPEETHEAYPWDANSAVYAELTEISKLCESIASKYSVSQWVALATSLMQTTEQY